MKLSEIVVREAIVPSLSSSTRDEAVAELLSALIAAGAADLRDQENLFQLVMERERRGSTGFGKGVAVPHVKHPNASQIVAAVGLSQTGVDFSALDKQPVHSIVLLLSPLDQPEEHLKAMEVIFKNLSQEMFRRFLKQATSIEEVWTILEEADNNTLILD